MCSSKIFRLASSNNELRLELSVTLVELEWIRADCLNPLCTFKGWDIDIELLSAKLLAVKVDVTAREP